MHLDHFIACRQRGLSLRITLLLLLVLVLTTAAVTAWRWYMRPLPMPAERIEVEVAPGAHTRAIARSLVQAGLDINEDVFVAVVRVTGAMHSLRAGRYEFVRGMTMGAVIDQLRRGKVMPSRFTIVEGWTVRQIRAALTQVDTLKPDSASLSDVELMHAIGATEPHIEGLLAPDTYVFDPGSSDLEVLLRAYQSQKQILQQAWQTRAPDLPYQNSYEALIMASIIEKETAQKEERGLIAGVFVNRIRKDMLLQSDPTVIYGLGDTFDGDIRTKDLRSDTPYNSYTRKGLPPTPIATPGRDAIEAALHPASTKALYFVSRGNGTSHFSETLAEHNRAVIRHQLKGRP